MFTAADLFNLSQTAHAAIFDGCNYAWDALKRIQAYLEANLRPGLHHRCAGSAFIGERVFIGEGTLVEDGAMIKGPAIIGRNCEIRHNAYIREQVIIGDNCIVGNSCEVKNSILFNQAVAPHFNYIGDSILGYQAHLGAGVKISNVKLPRSVNYMRPGKKQFLISNTSRSPWRALKAVAAASTTYRSATSWLRISQILPTRRVAIFWCRDSRSR